MAYLSRMYATARVLCAFAAAGTFVACGGPQSATTVPPVAFASTSSSGPSPATIAFSYATLDEQYTNFNELLSINNIGRIVGFEGAGTSSDPSVGYLARPPYELKDYKAVSYPGASSTVASGLNNRRYVVGYFDDPQKAQTLGFAFINNLWSAYRDPHARAKGSTTELLAVNDSDMAVGFYKAGSSSGAFEMEVATGKFTPITPPNGKNAVATSINSRADIVGYCTKPDGNIVGFLLLGASRTFYTFSYPNATSTKFLGVTVADRIVGSFVDKRGQTHGFLLRHPLRHTISWQRIDEPDAVGTTVAAAINLHYDIVGWYVDSSGTTHGFLATPKSTQ